MFIYHDKNLPFYMRYALDSILKQGFQLYNNSQQYSTPYHVADTIRKRQIKSEEIVLKFIQRAIEIDKTHSIIFEKRFDEAINEARNVDLLIQNEALDLNYMEKVYSLCGVPIYVPESAKIEGMSGINFDDDIVSYLRRSGAIIVFKINNGCQQLFESKY